MIGYRLRDAVKSDATEMALYEIGLPLAENWNNVFGNLMTS